MLEYIIINFQKCLFAANFGVSSDRHFTYILDLTDKVFVKLANMGRPVDIVDITLSKIYFLIYNTDSEIEKCCVSKNKIKEFNRN